MRSSGGLLPRTMKPQNSRDRFVICVKNRGFAGSIELRKVYRALRDSGAEERGLLRVADESGEDYLFPRACFVNIELPASVAREVMAG